MEDKIKDQQTVVNKLEHEKREKKDDKETTAAKGVLKELNEKKRQIKLSIETYKGALISSNNEELE